MLPGRHLGFVIQISRCVKKKMENRESENLGITVRGFILEGS